MSAGGAHADRPAEFTESATFTDVDPCTGEVHEVTIESSVRLHVHDGRTVAHLSRTGSTDSGYVMEHGVLSDQFNGMVGRFALTDNWTNDDGSRFQARNVVVFNGNKGEVIVSKFTLRCVRP